MDIGRQHPSAAQEKAGTVEILNKPSGAVHSGRLETVVGFR
jgi:hypothetical protein